MKKTDRPKYIKLAICRVALATFAAGYQTIAVFISVPAVLVIGFAPNKSGLFFTVAVFFSMFTTGFLVDYPYNKFPATGQKKILNERFDAWKGNLDQVDDVTIIGVRV